MTANFVGIGASLRVGGFRDRDAVENDPGQLGWNAEVLLGLPHDVRRHPGDERRGRSAQQTAFELDHPLLLAIEMIPEGFGVAKPR